MNNSLYIKQISISEPVPEFLYLYDLPIVRYLARCPITFTKPVTFFVGENGIGKSTLIEALAVAVGFNPEGGSKNFIFSTRNSHSSLYQYLNVVKGPRARDGYFLRAESFYNLATNIEELDSVPASATPILQSYGGVSLHEQSHGESFMTLIEQRFHGNGLFILDEPEAALSPMRILRLLCEMDRLVKNHSQLIISTHSPMLMAFPEAEIFQISQETVEKVDFQDTEHYKITKMFLDHPDRMLHHLLDENEGPAE